MSKYLIVIVAVLILFFAQYVDFLGTSTFVKSFHGDSDHTSGEGLLFMAFICAIAVYKLVWGSEPPK